MATRTKVTSVLSLCSSKWLLAAFVLLGCKQAFSQEVTFKVRKDTQVLENIDTLIIYKRKIAEFRFNDSITDGIISKRYMMRNGMKLTSNIDEANILGYELSCEIKNGFYKNFVIHGDNIPKKVLKQINKMPNGSTIIVGAIRTSNHYLKKYTYRFLTLKLTD
jgi:hypothetical protein